MYYVVLSLYRASLYTGYSVMVQFALIGLPGCIIYAVHSRFIGGQGVLFPVIHIGGVGYRGGVGYPRGIVGVRVRVGSFNQKKIKKYKLHRGGGRREGKW